MAEWITSLLFRRVLNLGVKMSPHLLHDIALTKIIYYFSITVFSMIALQKAIKHLTNFLTNSVFFLQMRQIYYNPWIVFLFQISMTNGHEIGIREKWK